MSTSSNPLDALASPTPVSEAEEIPAEPGRNTRAIAPVLIQEQFLNEVKTKAFLNTANSVPVVECDEDVQLSEPSQESNFKPQGKLYISVH